MVELTFYGGLREIGGTKILLRTDKGSIFIDFGKNFSQEGAFYEEPFNPPFHILSLLRIGALPDIEGLYRTDPGRPVDGVLISHAHLDHCGHVPLLSPQIPVYASDETRELMLIRSGTWDRTWQNDYSLTQWATFAGGQRTEVPGTDIAFTPYPVDHSVPGSNAFVIEAGGKTIAYTGDLRMHGRNPDATLAFLDELRQRDIDLLLCEGTHVAPEEDPGRDLLNRAERVLAGRMSEVAPLRVVLPAACEADVEAQLTEVVASARGLVMVEIPPIDLERLLSVWHATVAAGRVLVLPSRLAYIVMNARDRLPGLDLPDVYRTGLYLSQIKMRQDKRGPTDPLDAEELVDGRRGWEQRLAWRWGRAGGYIFGLPLGRELFREAPERFVICTSQAVNVLSELCYDGAPCPLTFVLSRTLPFDLAMTLGHDRLIHWLALYGCRKFYHVHVSGHMSADRIGELIRAAQPTRFIPIHTEHPELFKQFHARVATTKGALMRLDDV